MAALKRPAERPTFADQPFVTDNFVDRSGTHTGCQGLPTTRGHERGLLNAGVAGWRGIDSARCHELDATGWPVSRQLQLRE
jgi:hypothetical protein